jgi:Protein of unknown function (DUF3429)
MPVDAVTLHATAAPSPWAWRLGYGGLLPFVVGAALVWLVRADVLPYVARGLAAYGALIVSFLGGMHWGLAMRQPTPSTRGLVWGVVPSLLAWPAVMMPPHAGLVHVGLLLVLTYAVDRVLYAEHEVAHWLTLRFRLSSVAALCCFIGAAGS